MCCVCMYVCVFMSVYVCMYVCVCVCGLSDDDYMQNVHNREKVKQFVNVLQCAEQFSDKGKQVY